VLDLQNLVSVASSASAALHTYVILDFILPKRSPLVPAGNRGRARGQPAELPQFSMQLRQKLHPVREDDNEDVDDGLPYRQFAEYLDDDAPAEDESDGDVDMYEWDETTLYEHFLSDGYVGFLVAS
jgi:hypothetical protein